MPGLTQPLEFRKNMRSTPLPGFDVVPFLDAIVIAVFVALNASIFVLTPGTAIQLPVSEMVQSSQAGPTAVLTVDRNELYFFEGRKLAKNSLENQLRRFIEDLGGRHPGEGAVLLLKADSTITSSTLFNLLDVARRAGFSQVHLAAELQPASGNPWNDG